ncbi:hypothetical protein MAP00_008949 [Monascus purpureus]|nr:hypothetical protein MAP00_008949 [Monascus purpureus]
MKSFRAIRSRHSKSRAILHLTLAVVVLCLIKLLFAYRTSEANMHRGHRPQPVIGKVTMIYGNHTVYERALDTHREHGRRLGYPLTVLRKPILDGVWNKCAILLSMLLQELEKPEGQRLEWLFWFDSDTVLMNPNMPLETFLPPSHLSNVHLLLTKDWNGVNNGVFPIRVHPWSVELLSAVLSYPTMNPDVDLFWHEQSAMSNILEESKYFADSVVFCPLRWFNAYMRHPNGEDLNPDSPADLQVHPGDLLVHFPGTPRDKLEETLGPYLAIAQAHREKWEPRLESTGYMEETRKFWEKIQREPR